MVSKSFYEKGFEKLISSLAVLTMALLTGAVSFLWDLSKSVQVLNSQIGVVIEQVSSNERHFQIQLEAHEKLIQYQTEKIDDITDQLRILNGRISYITTFVNKQK